MNYIIILFFILFILVVIYFKKNLFSNSLVKPIKKVKTVKPKIKENNLLNQDNIINYYTDTNSIKKVTLYYADWCSHCKPVHLYFNDLIKNYPESDIIFNQMEVSEFKSIPQIYNKISGFPTILIEFNGSELVYSGSRDQESLINYVKQL